MTLQALLSRAATPQVAFVGPYGVGKSSAVRAVSHTEVVETSEPRLRDAQQSRSARRGAGEEHGVWHGPGGTVSVVSVAGQARFQPSDVMRPGIPPRVVLWLYGHTPDALEEAEEWLRYICPDLGASPLAVAVTRLEIPGDRPALADYRRVVDRWCRGAPILSADPRDRESVEEVLEAVLRAGVAASPVRTGR